MMQAAGISICRSEKVATQLLVTVDIRPIARRPLSWSFNAVKRWSAIAICPVVFMRQKPLQMNQLHGPIKTSANSCDQRFSRVDFRKQEMSDVNRCCVGSSRIFRQITGTLPLPLPASGGTFHGHS
jgi:hypothetical protein